jgi:nicotinate-nucleotide adenylyltransferase
LSHTALNAPQKIGILGGTFDPPHIGHLRLATYFAKLLNLDTVLLIPSGEPWQKGSHITCANVRYQLTEAAGIDLARAFLYLKIPTQVGIDRIEIDRPGPSYAIDTAQALRERFGSTTNLIWLMGADSLLALPSWHRWQELIQYINIAVASRPNHHLTADMQSTLSGFLSQHQVFTASDLEKHPYGHIWVDEHLAINLSSTELREQLQSSARTSIGSDQIPSHTLEIITKLGLYQ